MRFEQNFYLFSHIKDNLKDNMMNNFEIRLFKPHFDVGLKGPYLYSSDYAFIFLRAYIAYYSNNFVNLCKEFINNLCNGFNNTWL